MSAVAAPWIQAHSGLKVSLSRPMLDQIDFADIAHALAHICRYNGHTSDFYSVAEHCTHAANEALNRNVPALDCLAILLHDAAEAYIGDMVKPLKDTMPKFVEAEDRMMQTIIEKFGLHRANWKLVKEYDVRMLITEKEILMNQNANHHWDGFEGIEPFPDLVISCHNPAMAKLMFVRMFMHICNLIESERSDEF